MPLKCLTSVGYKFPDNRIDSCEKFNRVHNTTPDKNIREREVLYGNENFFFMVRLVVLVIFTR